ncbi:MbtH family protein [Streptomyces thermolineatus]|uniref:MbtH family protein n=1 Tax=Streptomyces thermolineatus TaxID=44033 RepID=A0ABP5Z323_9ACTN
MSTRSPFDADQDAPAGAATHLVLHNDRGEASLWPAFAAVPAGWTAVFGPAPHAACEAHIEHNDEL